MKKLIYLLLAIATISCTSVNSGHKGVEVSWGGKTNMDQVYPEGMHYGLNWIFDDMVEYDVKEHTATHKFQFNDKNDMRVDVTIALDYKLVPDKVNFIHSTITDIDTKISTSLSSAAKETVPQYSAVELNKHKREAAELNLSAILSKELPEFYVEFKRIRITDVDIPDGISKLAEETAVQIGKNELASKKEAEQVALAKARIAEAEGEYQASILQAKTRDILSQPKMLELQRVENERIMWEGYKAHGHSPFGNNNMYGVVPAIVKGLGK